MRRINICTIFLFALVAIMLNIMPSNALAQAEIDDVAKLKYDFSSLSDDVIKARIQKWSQAMFTNTELKFTTEEGAEINAVLLYTPLIQLGQNELTSRFVKRSTRIAIFISIVTLLISVLALGISWTALRVSKNTVGTEAKFNTEPTTSSPNKDTEPNPIP